MFAIVGTGCAASIETFPSVSRIHMGLEKPDAAEHPATSTKAHEGLCRPREGLS